jgi:CBS domain-containing protein
MITISQILAEKKKPLTTVLPSDTVMRAIELMRERDVGCVMVVENQKLLGMFTERDCVHKVSSLGLDPISVTVSDVMTTKVRFANPNMEVSRGCK